MLFVLSEELFSNFQKMDSNEKESFKKFLKNLVLLNKYEKKHIFILENRKIFKLLNNEFIDFFETENEIMSFIQNIGKIDYINMQVIKDLNIFTDITFITYEKKFLKNEDNYYIRFIPYIEFLDSATLQNTHLIVEHIKNDSNIYEIFTRYYFEMLKNDIKKILTYNYEIIHGGGSSVKAVLEKYCDKENVSLSVFIVDGDRKSPVKTGIGSTAKGINKIFKRPWCLNTIQFIRH